MGTISELKEQSITETPLVLFDCELRSGTIERWSTHQVVYEDNQYVPRVLRHNLFEMRSWSEEGVDAIARISILLANADSHFSQIERNTGWKGSRVTVRFVFFDLRNGSAASEAAVLFRGTADAPDEITESTFRLTVASSLNLQRVLLPDVRIERRCPWKFPATEAQRDDATAGGSEGKYSAFYRCGYSADREQGTGNLNAEAPYTSCTGTRAQCEERGMFSTDAGGRATRRFGGIEFVPPSTLVRSHGEKGSHISSTVENSARYNDFVPLIYGTAWYSPPIVFSKNDGNLTRMEVLLGMGEIERVLKVLVNDIDIPQGQAGRNMTATGWFNVISTGGRTGGFNLDFSDGSGHALGDPYGSMAVMSVVVPNRVNDGRTLPRVDVLMQGVKLDQFAPDGAYLGESFTNNPAWILLDLLRRSGWRLDNIDLTSFGVAAASCAEWIPAQDLNGNPIQIPRYECNLALRRRRSAGDVIRGIRNAARLYLTYSPDGKLQLRVEDTIDRQQPEKSSGSNSVEPLAGGWPMYEFGDGSSGKSGILRRENGEPAIRVFCRSTAETPNRASLEFQDALNEYQQDSMSITDMEDVLKAGQEVSVSVPALGVSNPHQAMRIVRLHLDKAIGGNTYVEFETSVRALGLKPGDIITLTYLKEGFQRQPFRVLKIAPAVNYRTAMVTAQIHKDEWYTDEASLTNPAAGRQGAPGLGTPRPVAGTSIDEYGIQQFEIEEKSQQEADGGTRLTLEAKFVPPPKPAVGRAGIPIVSLAARIDSEGGTLRGDQTLYYAVAAVDAAGAESGLSFLVPAAVPPGSNTNTVTIEGLSFGDSATTFNVYRGPTPYELLRVASSQPLTAEFTDPGLDAEPLPPPDENYDHANFYWRYELQPENVATEYSNAAIGNSGLGMALNGFRGMVARIVRGTGAGRERSITSNTATILNVSPPWDLRPDSSSYFVIAESGWHFGAAASGSPVEFEVPGRVGATVHVCGRAANALDREAAYELSPVTRFRLTGAGAPVDEDVPGQPLFGLAVRGRGALELTAVAFPDLNNTRTINSATLTLNYWNELNSPCQVALASALSAEETLIELSKPGSADAGNLLQVGSEILRVRQVLAEGTRYEVERGAHGSAATGHSVSEPIYHLERKAFIVPFARDFFGSPASGDFCYQLLLPDARIASAELFVTNAHGNSDTRDACYTGTVDQGLRTHSGGQFAIQVEGHLAIQSNAAPPLVVEQTHSIRDVFAVLGEAPTSDPVELVVRVDGDILCELAVPAGSTQSSAVNGFGLPPLLAGSQITLDIVAVGQSTDALPGRDLTTVIRL